MRPTLVALALAVTIAGCGSDKKDSSSTTTPAKTTTGASTALPGGKTVRGTGYSFEIPATWHDGSAALKGSAIKFDVAYINSRSKTPPKENIIVIRENPPGINDNQLALVEKTFRGQAISLADKQGVGPTRSVKLGGDDADTYDYIMSEGNGLGHQRQEFAIHDGAVYTITWTAPSKSYAESNKLFDQVLASWQWTP
jgi:hypothetical protein